jgi:hypothetical protein
VRRAVCLPIVVALLAGAGAGCRSESEPPASGQPPAHVEKFVWEVGAGDGTALRCVRDHDGERCKVIRTLSAPALSYHTAVEAVRSYLRGDPRGAPRSVDCRVHEGSDRARCDVDFETICDVLVVTRRGADLVVEHPRHGLCIHAVD